jgi:hypothetical protein
VRTESGSWLEDGGGCFVVVCSIVKGELCAKEVEAELEMDVISACEIPLFTGGGGSEELVCED